MRRPLPQIVLPDRLPLGGISPDKMAGGCLNPFGASGEAHSKGLVPDPGAVGGSTRYLREDATWATPAGASAPEWGDLGGDIADQADLAAALGTKAATSHGHAIAETTGLQAALDGKAGTGHDHDGAYADLEGGRVPVAQLGSGSPSGSTFLRGDGSWATPAGGGAPMLVVNLISDAANVPWTNMPAAVTFFGGSHRWATKVDLTGFSQVRLVVNKQATAGAAAAVVRLRYIAAFSTTVGNWLQIGESSVQVAVNVQNQVLASAWINLAAGAKADVFVTLDGSGGDGVLDPGFGAIAAQFK